MLVDYGACIAGRDALAARHMQMLRAAPRGCVASSMAVGCIVAAEAFAQGLSAWAESTGAPRAYGMAASAGGGSEGAAGAHMSLRRMAHL